MARFPGGGARAFSADLIPKSQPYRVNPWLLITSNPFPKARALQRKVFAVRASCRCSLCWPKVSSSTLHAGEQAGTWSTSRHRRCCAGALLPSGRGQCTVVTAQPVTDWQREPKPCSDVILKHSF